ncbi:MAG: DNA internalization-related competence protein ComEC/Rec2 [Actinomycetota bacterium]
MTAWILPVLAAAFWAGILLQAPLRAVPSMALVAGGLGLLGLGVALAPAMRGARDPLAEAGLAPAEHPALMALHQARPAGERAPPVAALAMVLAFAVLGAGWAGMRAERLQHSYLAHLNGRHVLVEGDLRSDPEPGAYGWSAPAAVTGLRTDGERVRLHEQTWLEGADAVPDVRRGDRFVAEARVSIPYDSGFAEFLGRRGSSSVLNVERFRRTGPSADPLIRAAQAVRATLTDRLRALMPARQAGLLMGLALGDTSMLDAADEEHFRATGLGHLLAVSGENVAMLLAPILGLAVLLRLSVRGRFVMGVGTVVFFVVLTGAEPSVLRAGVMAVLALTGVLLGRPRSTGSILGGAVLLLLAADPALVHDIGFQLSVAATAGMIALAGPLSLKLRRLPAPIALAAAATLAAQIGVSPLLLYHFHQVPEVTLIANLLAFPAVAPAMLLGLAAAAASLAFEPLGVVLAKLAEAPIRYLQWLADRLASAPFPTITSPGGAGALVAGFAVVALCVWWLRSARRVPRSALVAGVLVVPLFLLSTAIRAGPPSGLVVRFLDVGQGDAALVSSPGGANVLIDGGPDPQLVATKLAALGVKRLDAVVATHPHLDHFVGLPAVLARIPVRLVVDSGCAPPESRSAPYRAFLRAVRAEGIPEEHPRLGDVLMIGDLRFEVVSPDRCWNGTNSDPNNDSLVLLLSYREDTVLFANEPEADAQQVMLDDGEPLTAAVLNVPHHGAGTSIEPFLQAVHELVAVVSVGPNTYGHPVPQTLEWLRDSGARVFRTDRSGDVVITFEPPGISVDTARGRDLVIDTRH